MYTKVYMSLCDSFLAPPAEVLATNVRRLMAREGLTYDGVVDASGLDERTVRGLVQGTNRPHARTLHKLAAGLGATVDELFSRAGIDEERAFDRASNPILDELAVNHPETFRDWSADDFADLASRFGTGGQLTEDGALAAAAAINRRREVLTQATIVMETADADLLADFVAMLYRRVTSFPPTANRVGRCGGEEQLS